MEEYEIEKSVIEKLPREKMIASGPDVLDLSELLAIVLNMGTKKEGVMELSNRLLREYGSKGIVNETNVGRMKEEYGVAEVHACKLIACFEIGRRLFLEVHGKLPFLRSPEDVSKYLEDMKRLKKEEFRGLYLNTRNRLIHDEAVSIGTLTANLVHPREVFQPAVAYSAAAIIVAHNHPSGDAEPSDEDLKVTNQLIEAGKHMGIPLLDHVIIGSDSFVSLKNRRLIR